MTGSQRGDSSVTPDAEGDAVSAPASLASVVPLSVVARAGVAVRRGRTAVLEAVRELWLHPDRLLYVMWHGKPESMAEHRAYMKSRAWVPPGMDGGAEKAVSIAGIAYHLIIARPLKAAAKTVDAAADRPLRLLCLAAFILALLVIFALL